MPKKTMWILLVWLVFMAASVGLQAVMAPQLPLALVVNLTGYITLAYVGLSKGGNIVKAVKAPAGEFGFDYTPARRDRLLWLTIVWLVLIAEILVVRAIAPEGTLLPVEEVIGFAGALSVVYVGANKGEQMAAAAGKPKEHAT